MLRAATNGGSRRANDFYATPPEPTIALLPHLQDWPRRVWEPACGEGDIMRPLERAGFDVVGTDLVDRGVGTGGVDFLATRERLADAIITNPPFGKLFTPFVAHAHALGVPFIAMLSNVNVWHAERRTALWHRRPPAVIYALTFRPDFTGSGSPYFNCIWSVWGPQRVEQTRYELLELPKWT